MTRLERIDHMVDELLEVERYHVNLVVVRTLTYPVSKPKRHPV